MPSQHTAPTPAPPAPTITYPRTSNGRSILDIASEHERGAPPPSPQAPRAAVAWHRRCCCPAATEIAIHNLAFGHTDASRDAFQQGTLRHLRPHRSSPRTKNCIVSLRYRGKLPTHNAHSPRQSSPWLQHGPHSPTRTATVHAPTAAAMPALTPHMHTGHTERCLEHQGAHPYILHK